MDLKKSFMVGDQEVPVIKGVNLRIYPGDFVIIFGPSGCGKSTMLHTILGLEPPSGGEILIESKDFYEGDEDSRSTYRKHKIGMIYQQPLWVKALNVLDNVSFPLFLLGIDDDLAREKALTSLRSVGMENWAKYWPMELSSGQQQKVSLARSLVIDPVLIAADEPTGNLDTVSGQELMETLARLNQDFGKTIMMITHDLEYLKYATRIFHMVDGQIVESAERKASQKLRLDVSGKKTVIVGEANVRDPNFLKNMHSKFEVTSHAFKGNKEAEAEEEGK